MVDDHARPLLDHHRNHCFRRQVDASDVHRQNSIPLFLSTSCQADAPMPGVVEQHVDPPVRASQRPSRPLRTRRPSRPDASRKRAASGTDLLPTTSADAASTSPISTTAPSFANALAVAAPIPLPLPVIRQTLSFSLPPYSLLSSGCSYDTLREILQNSCHLSRRYPLHHGWTTSYSLLFKSETWLLQFGTENLEDDKNNNSYGLHNYCYVLVVEESQTQIGGETVDIQGYLRADGRVASATTCLPPVSYEVNQIADCIVNQVLGAVTFRNQHGIDQSGADLLRRSGSTKASPHIRTCSGS